MRNPTAIKIVNDALVQSGLEAEFPVNLKSILMLIVEASIRQGYVDGYEDAEKPIPPKITRDKLLDFKKLYEKARTKHNRD